MQVTDNLQLNTNPKSWLCVTLPDILELVKLEAAMNKNKYTVKVNQ